VSAPGLDDGDISYALVCLKTGALLEVFGGSPASARVEDLAAASAELFRAGNPANLAALFERLGSQYRGELFQEIVFVSARAAHVVQRLAEKPEVALLAVSVDAGKLALMLSGVHTLMLQQEARP
jgi:hypothetical protein